MVGVRLSSRFVGSVLARGAVAALAVAILAVMPSRGTSAEDPFDLTGVVCMDIYLDNEPFLENKGDAAGPEDDRATKLLSRIEPSATQPGGWDVTSVAYTGPGDLLPTKPPSDETCKAKTDGNSLNPLVPFQQVDISLRPTATAKLVEKGADWNLEWQVCQYEPELLGGMYVLSKFNIVLTGKTMTQDNGTLTAYLDPDSCTTGALIQYATIIESAARTDTKGDPDPALADDWDGDGCSDWDELRPLVPLGRDPFNPGDCPSVGGIAELPEVAGTPLEAVDSSGGGAGLIAAVAAAIAAGALALGAGAWYVRRRRPG